MLNENAANQMRELQESLEKKCPFCRHPAPDDEKEVKINLMRRIEVNDPAASSNAPNGTICLLSFGRGAQINR
eukprot:scaffold12407_cov112-Skeletonema_marinoi.AAC.1